MKPENELFGIVLAIVLRQTGLGPSALTWEEATARFSRLSASDQSRVRYLAAQFIAARPSQFPAGMVDAASGILRKAGTAEAYQAMTTVQPEPGALDLAGQFVSETGKEAAGMVLPGGLLWKLVTVAVVVAVAAYVLPGAISKAVRNP